MTDEQRASLKAMMMDLINDRGESAEQNFSAYITTKTQHAAGLAPQQEETTAE